MTEEKFTELVNLYLDKEISERGLAELKVELEESVERKAEFAERCRLHQAMRLAMNPAASQRRSASKRSSSRSSSRGLSRASTARTSTARTAARSSGRSGAGSARREVSSEKVTTFPRWMMGAGLAACFALGVTLLVPVFRDTTAAASQPALAGVDADELVEENPLDRIGRAELRRFAMIQKQREANQSASIAAQLRLMGLRPEFTPEEKQLRSVSAAAAQRPTPVRNDAALLAEVQKLSPMPAQQILRTESMHAEPAVRWPGGFHSSLASFK